MSKLDFDDDVATYRGYTITAIPDESHDNPFAHQDTEPPMVASVCGNSSCTHYGLSLEPPILSAENITANAKDIADFFGRDILLDILNGANPVALINGLIYDYDYERVNFVNDKDRFDYLAMVYGWCGIPAHVTTVHGYSQGDTADLLIVLTPEWVRTVGVNITDPTTVDSIFQSIADLYRWWAFGDVYGYIIEDPNGDELGSCFGFYGPHDTSGLAEAAIVEIDADIARIRKTRTTKLKTLIQHRVPLQARAATLAALT